MSIDLAAMHIKHTRPIYAYQRTPDQEPGRFARHPVVIVGAGPVGLTAAVDLATRGIRVVLIDEDNTTSEGSRALTYARRSLQIWQRLGCVHQIVERGVHWGRGSIYWGDQKVYEFGGDDADPDESTPPFVNFQQYHLEELLVDRCVELGVDLRWKNRLINVENSTDGPVLRVSTPDGEYSMTCDWLLAADGARSTVRRSLGLKFAGRIFEEKFLICDLYINSEFSRERAFWFEPPFNPRHTSLMQAQPDGMWRIGMQLGIRNEEDFNPEREVSAECLHPRLKRMLGKDAQFEVDWASIYNFQCRRLENFRAGRVVFIGDSAHQVSPFGGRGANSGIQDVDNLVWKLQLVLEGKAPEELIDTYHDERSFAADENILHSTRSTDFITPKTSTARHYRSAVLGLAKRYPFARSLVNSGRMSTPSTYTESRLNTLNDFGCEGGVQPGSPCSDVRLKTSQGVEHLLSMLRGNFVGISYGIAAEGSKMEQELAQLDPPVQLLTISMSGQDGAVIDETGEFARRYAIQKNGFYLLRPDQHVAARWKQYDIRNVNRALQRACGIEV